MLTFYVSQIFFMQVIWSQVSQENQWVWRGLKRTADIGLRFQRAYHLPMESWTSLADPRTHDTLHSLTNITHHHSGSRGSTGSQQIINGATDSRHTSLTNSRHTSLTESRTPDTHLSQRHGLCLPALFGTRASTASAYLHCSGHVPARSLSIPRPGDVAP